MFSPADTALVVGLALLLFGPKKLPEIGKSIGLGLNSFKKALSDPTPEEPKPSEKTETKKVVSEEAVASKPE